MFKKYFLIILLLVACESATQKLPLLTVSVKSHMQNYTVPKLGMGCSWAQKELPIFNQKAQTISFKYRDCPEDEISFTINPTRDFIHQISEINLPKTFKLNPGQSRLSVMKTPVVRVQKLGPNNIEEFLENNLIRQASIGNTSVCEIVKLSANRWIYDFSKIDDIEVPSSDMCREHRFSEFIFVDGIVFQIWPKLGTVVDLSSISYKTYG